jgi:hypothetical protein
MAVRHTQREATVTGIAERVAAGAAFLDEHDPEWWLADVERAIDLEVLDLTRTDECVLGQRCPLEVLGVWVGTDVHELAPIDFGEAYDAYARHLSGLSGRDRFEWATGLGFALARADDRAGGNWLDLTDEWTRVITERRSAS